MPQVKNWFKSTKFNWLNNHLSLESRNIICKRLQKHFTTLLATIRGSTVTLPYRGTTFLLSGRQMTLHATSTMAIRN